jgi:hypothetical protein
MGGREAWRQQLTPAHMMSLLWGSLTSFAQLARLGPFSFAKASSRNSFASWTFKRQQSRMSFEKRFRHFFGSRRGSADGPLKNPRF